VARSQRIREELFGLERGSRKADLVPKLDGLICPRISKSNLVQLYLVRSGKFFLIPHLLLLLVQESLDVLYFLSIFTSLLLIPLSQKTGTLLLTFASGNAHVSLAHN
jgi:hypothetical protein